MRICKIRNKYLFESDNPYGLHSYAVYHDYKNKENRAVALTHLYIKDNNRFKQVQRGNIMISKFKNFDVPTGVQNYYYSSDVYGNKIDLKNPNIVYIDKSHINKTRANSIKNFASNRYFKGKKCIYKKRIP